MSYSRCIEYVYETGSFPPECLNDWPTMKQVCLANILKQPHDQYPELIEAFQREVKRFYQLWLSDRVMFAQEVNAFYYEPT